MALSAASSPSIRSKSNTLWSSRVPEREAIVVWADLEPSGLAEPRRLGYVANRQRRRDVDAPNPAPQPAQADAADLDLVMALQ